VCDDEQAQIPEGNEFQTEWAATPKLWEIKVVWTRETANRLVLEERRERTYGNMLTKKRAEVSTDYNC